MAAAIISSPRTSPQLLIPRLVVRTMLVLRWLWLTTWKNAAAASAGTSTWTRAAWCCCSRSPPNARNEPRSPAPAAPRSASGTRPSPTRGPPPRTCTVSPSTTGSSRPAATATGSDQAARLARRPPLAEPPKPPCALTHRDRRGYRQPPQDHRGWGQIKRGAKWARHSHGTAATAGHPIWAHPVGTPSPPPLEGPCRGHGKNDQCGAWVAAKWSVFASVDRPSASVSATLEVVTNTAGRSACNHRVRREDRVRGGLYEPPPSSSCPTRRGNARLPRGPIRTRSGVPRRRGP